MVLAVVLMVMLFIEYLFPGVCPVFISEGFVPFVVIT